MRLAPRLPCWRRRCFQWWSLSTSTPLLSTYTVSLSHPTALAGRGERFYVTDKSADKAIHCATTPNTRVRAAPPSPTRGILVHDDYWVSSVASGRLRQDTAQRAVARRLQRLQIALQSYDPTPFRHAHRDYLYQHEQQKFLSDAQQKSFQGRQRREGDQLSPHSTPRANASTTTTIAQEPVPAQPSQLPMMIPKGLYLYGSVGTGKSMLVDAFFACLDDGGDDRVVAKRRYHYHEFLHDIHERLHAQSWQERTQRQYVEHHPSKLVSTTTTTTNTVSAADHHNVSTNTESLASPVLASCPLAIQPTLLNPVVTVALAMAADYTLLCIDEFSVVDIADVVLVSQLLPTLLQAGTVLVITSNRSVAQLGHDWENATPMAARLVHSLRRHCIEHDMDSTIDYRQLLGSSTTTMTTAQDEDGGDLSQPALWVVPQPRHGSEPMSQSAAALTALQNFLAPTFDRHVWNATHTLHLDTGFQRTMRIQSISLTDDETGLALSIAHCTFDELCSGRGGGALGARAVPGNYYGPSDYRALARHFDALVLENIPVLSNGHPSGTAEELWRDHNEARRFITLVDELYEAQTLVVGSAMAPIAQLFAVVESRDNAPEATNSVKELQFAFRRSASRLVELSSQSKWVALLRGKVAQRSLHSDSAF
jgi:predicted ATPase